MSNNTTNPFAGLTPQQIQQAIQAVQAQPIVFPDVTHNMKPLNTLKNFKTVLAHYNIDIRYNDMTKDAEITMPGVPVGGALYNNAIIGHIKDLFARHQVPTGENFNQYVDAVAMENEFHPVKEWINSTVWDGRSRLQDYYDTIVLTDNNPMKEVMMRKWALSLVGALYHPNFACEGVLTFSGKQGIGKTTWIEELLPKIGKNKWNKSGCVLIMNNKDTVFKALSQWITELGELDATFRKSDIESLKAFITESVDVLRTPFDRKANKYPRKTVFYATVNDVEFLQDEENRRFWVLSVDHFNNGKLDVSQFWAEVKQIYLTFADKIIEASDRKKYNEYGWYMTPQERNQMKPLQQQFKSADPIEQRLENYIKPRNETGHQRENLNVTEIMERCGWDKPHKKDLNVAGKWLRNAGFEPDGTKKYDVEFYNQNLGSRDNYVYNERLNNSNLVKLTRKP
jgi:putative DNA primase/helicase